MANGGPEMTVILQNEGISPEAIEALLASTSPPDFHGSRSMLNFEDLHQSPPKYSLFRHVDVDETVLNDDFDESFHHPEKKRRLTSNQVQCLEKSFEVENKLEPERKMQLARDLGLQPRQVAIWFQNRRARWKTKQLEKDYESLKTSYDRLKDDYENLNKDKEQLKQEVQVLREKMIQKGMDDANMEAPRPENDAGSNQHLQGLDLDFVLEEKKPEPSPILTSKQEDMCSANSIVFDPESPLCTAEGGQYLAQLEPADSSNVLQELDNSDEEGGDKKVHGFPELDVDNPCNFGFPVEMEHGLWPWPC